MASPLHRSKNNNDRYVPFVSGGGQQVIGEGGAPGAADITVREVDSNPSVNPVAIIEFHQDDGFVVSDQGSSVVRVRLANVPQSIIVDLETDLSNLSTAISDVENDLSTLTTTVADKANASLTLTAGNGLTGGGDLSSDRTFTVGAGNGITVNADDVAVNQGFAFTWTAVHTFSPTARTSGANPYLKVTTPADTGQTADAEAPGIIFGGDGSHATVTRTLADGTTIALQREYRFVHPTYAAAGATTLTIAATVSITGAPVAGTSITITDGYALYVAGGTSRFDGAITCRGAGGNLSERFGINSAAAGNGATALGSDASASQFGTVAVGRAATASGNRAQAFGFVATASGSYSLNISAGGLTSSGDDSIGIMAGSGFAGAIGIRGTPTAANQLVIGGVQQAGSASNAPISNVFIGNGVTNASPASVTYNATGGSGTDIAGANLLMFAGKPTGSGAPGTFVIQFARPGSSGTTLRSQSEQIVYSYSTTDTLTESFQIQTSTTANTVAATNDVVWATATHASRKARQVFSIYDTAAREAIRIEASGTAAMIGFLGANAVVRQTLSAAATDPATTQTLANDLRTAMINLGLAA